ERSRPAPQTCCSAQNRRERESSPVSSLCPPKVGPNGLPSLSERVVQDQRVRNHLLPGLESRLDFLQIQIVRQEVSTDDFHAAKLLVGRGKVNKIAIVHVEDGGCRDNSVHLPGLTVKGGPHEHAQAHDSRILNFYPNLGRADVGIENRANVADRALEDLAGMGVPATRQGRFQQSRACTRSCSYWQEPSACKHFLSPPTILFGQAIFMHGRKSICLTGINHHCNVILLVNRVEEFQNRIIDPDEEGGPSM